MEYVLKEYQEKSKDALIKNNNLALLLYPGAGKTLITLSALDTLKKQGSCKKILLIAPLLVCELVWPQEIEKWGFEFRYVFLHGAKKEELINTQADIYLINPEGLGWLFEYFRCCFSLAKLKAFSFDTLVIDELTRFKNSNTLGFKVLDRIRSVFRRIWGLTGSLGASGLEHVFWQMYMVDGGASLGRYITPFREKHFYPLYLGEYKRQPKPGALDNVGTAIRKHAFYMSAEDYTKLPDLIENIVYVDLPKKASKYYREVEKKFFSNIDGKTITACNIVSSIGKCRQVASGSVYDDNGEVVSIHNAKTDALLMLLEELQETQVLIVIEYIHEADKLKSILGESTAIINGKTSSNERKNIVDVWNAGELLRLIVHPKSTKYGLNLQGSSANYIIFYSPQYSYESHDQVIRRVYRQGNKSDKVLLYIILARNTVDSVIYRVLKTKGRDEAALINCIMEYKNERHTRSFRRF